MFEVTSYKLYASALSCGEYLLLAWSRSLFYCEYCLMESCSHDSFGNTESTLELFDAQVLYIGYLLRRQTVSCLDSAHCENGVDLVTDA